MYPNASPVQGMLDKSSASSDDEPADHTVHMRIERLPAPAHTLSHHEAVYNANERHLECSFLKMTGMDVEIRWQQSRSLEREKFRWNPAPMLVRAVGEVVNLDIDKNIFCPFPGAGFCLSRSVYFKEKAWTRCRCVRNGPMHIACLARAVRD